jgi:hypothetical protein
MRKISSLTLLAISSSPNVFTASTTVALLGLLDNSKIIILGDSDDEKEEVREEKFTGIEDATAFAAVNPTSTASANDVYAPARAKIDNSDDQGANQEAGGEVIG